MDPFDDILPVAPAARVRAGGRFVPKAKSKLLPRKETSTSEHASATLAKDGKSEHVVSSSISIKTDGISLNESIHHPQEKLSNSENTSNSELGKSQKVSVDRDTAALVDPMPSTISAPEVDTDCNFKNIPKSAHAADLEGFDVGLTANSLPETNLSNCPTQPVQSANIVEDVLSNVAAPSASCLTTGGMEEPPKSGEDSFISGTRHSELIDDSLQVGPNVSFKVEKPHEVAMLEGNIHSNSKFGGEQEVEFWGEDPLMFQFHMIMSCENISTIHIIKGGKLKVINHDVFFLKCEFGNDNLSLALFQSRAFKKRSASTKKHGIVTYQSNPVL